MGEKDILTKKGTHYRRFCVYFFYDPHGYVDEYVMDCLREMSVHCEAILVVSNTQLQTGSKKLLKTISNLSITERPNVGFDVWAYKHGIETVGWKKLVEYDEVIFMNFTIVGPIYPFKEMFDSMSSRQVDFWGINVHAGEPYDPWGTMPEGVIPKHIQSHFIAVRKPMLKSPELKAYWQNMRPIKTYHEAVGFHEAIFTQTFEHLGFKWESYIQTDDLDELTSYPLMFMPREVIVNRRCPIFKRKALILPLEEYTGCTMGHNGQDTLRILEELDYDISKVIPNILRTANQYDIRLAINAFHISTKTPKLPTPPASVAFILYLNTFRKYQAIEPYLSQLVASGEVRAVVYGRLAPKLTSLLRQYPSIKISRGNRLDFISHVIIASREFAYLGILGLNSYSPHYTGLGELELYRHSLNALFADRETINTNLSFLAKNAALYYGLTAPLAVHSSYGGEQRTWYMFNSQVKDTLTALGNQVAVSSAKLPLSSESGIFMVNSTSLRAIKNSSMRQALGRLPSSQVDKVFNLMVPFLLQQGGGLLSYVLPPTMSENYSTVLTHTNRHYRPPIDVVEQDVLSGAILPDAVQLLPVGTLYLAKNDHFTEEDKLTYLPRKNKNGSLKFRFNAPYRSRKVRFDPVEGLGIVCQNPKVTINGEVRKIKALGAISHGETDVFLTTDPQYLIRGEVNKGDRLDITFTNIKYYSLEGFVHPIRQNKPTENFRSKIGELQYYYKKGLKKH